MACLECLAGLDVDDADAGWAVPGEPQQEVWTARGNTTIAGFQTHGEQKRLRHGQGRLIKSLAGLQMWQKRERLGHTVRAVPQSSLVLRHADSAEEQAAHDLLFPAVALLQQGKL